MVQGLQNTIVMIYLETASCMSWLLAPTKKKKEIHCAILARECAWCLEAEK